MKIEETGKTIGQISVKISYRIIELFSGGLYTSPNKAFEELICNSYDAFADKVFIFLPDQITDKNGFIWVLDNGEGMDKDGLKTLWNIGNSHKQNNSQLDNKRKQIGQFGIGKLATFVLANKITHISKVAEKFFATTMDYSKIPNSDDRELLLDEKILTENETKSIIDYLIPDTKNLFMDLFGEESEESWTLAVLSDLKPKATEINRAKLKWILRTALPLNPGFIMYLNGNEIKSSKIQRPIIKEWIFGEENDETLEKVGGTSSINENNIEINFEHLKAVSGRIILYEDSLVDRTKSTRLGRSHGIFLLVRERLINLDDPLLGMSAFTHGVFNRTRILINADGLNKFLTSGRETIKESVELKELQNYVQKKFNNEIRKFYFSYSEKQEIRSSTPYRISQTPSLLSRNPLLSFAKKYFANEIFWPFTLQKLPKEETNELLQSFKEKLTDEKGFITDVIYEIFEPGDPIARLDLKSGSLKINLLHPFIACDSNKGKIPLQVQFVATNEVLTEAYLYELGIEENIVHEIMRTRDQIFRELVFSNKMSIPVVASYIQDNLNDSTGLEDAIYNAFIALGFETTKIGGNGKPDGRAEAILGYDEEAKSLNYSLIYDTKSTAGKKIKAGTAKTASLVRHKDDYSADFAVVIAPDFEGYEDKNSAISKEAYKQNVTVIRARDFIRLLFMVTPKQIGLDKLRELFETCHKPCDVIQWIDNLEDLNTVFGPIELIITTIYDLQQYDQEKPDLNSVRTLMNHTLTEHGKPKISLKDLRTIITSLQVFIPGLISISREKVGIQATPQRIIQTINEAITEIPEYYQDLYYKAFETIKK